MNLKRKEWVRALTAHPAPVLNELAEQLAAGCKITLINLPQAGLGLLTLTDGAFHEPYFLGEFPLASCRLELAFADGRRAEGGAQVMADDAGLARSLAILDAILAARLPGWELVSDLASAGAIQRDEQERRRHAMLAATRVDFALLSDTVEDGKENGNEN